MAFMLFNIILIDLFININRKEKSMRKIYFSFLCVIAIITIAMVSVNADIKNGTSWQIAEYVDVSPHGETKYNLAQGSKKTTTSDYGSMKASFGAILSPYGRFITKGKANRSEAISLSSSVKHPKLYNTADKGDVLYTKVSTNSLDPGYIEVSLKFSSDYLS